MLIIWKELRNIKEFNYKYLCFESLSETLSHVPSYDLNKAFEPKTKNERLTLSQSASCSQLNTAIA